MRQARRASSIIHAARGHGRWRTAGLLFGVREKPSDPFRYLRLPVDAQGEINGFLRLHAALSSPTDRAEAVRRYVAQAVDPGRRDLSAQLAESTSRALTLFAGRTDEAGKRHGGLAAISGLVHGSQCAGGGAFACGRGPDPDS